MVITKDQLTKAFKQWEQDHRDGKCLSPEETAKQTVDQVAVQSANHLWKLLESLK